MAQEQKKDLNFKYNYGKKVKPAKKKPVRSKPAPRKKAVRPMSLGAIALRNFLLFALALAILVGFFLLGTDLSLLQTDPEQLLFVIFQESTWKWIVLGVLVLLAGAYAIYKTMERDWFHEEGLTDLTILYAASMLATAFGCMIVVLMGESMYSDGGIARLLVQLSAICTGISALVYLIAMLAPVLLDRDFLYGLSVFVWKIVLSLVVALITFGIGALLYEIMEVYKIVHTVLAIGMVALMIFLFFAVVGFCAAHSVIANCFVEVSLGVLETAAAVETAWYDSIDWEATKRKREKLLREAEDILRDDGT